MPKKINKEEKQKSNLADDSKLFAFLATFLSIIGFILVLLLDKKKDKYIMYYAKQSLVIFIAGAIVGAISWILLIIPILGIIVQWIVGVGMLALWLISWINALSGEMKETPVVGSFANKIDL